MLSFAVQAILTLLEQLQYEVAPYFNLTMRMKSYVGVDRDPIAFMSQAMRPWYRFDRG
jgi:hypothetical protein